MNERPRVEAILAVALVSFSVLAAEVALTRVFSVLFRAPYVFLIVSGAIGGLGAGGLLAQLLHPREERLGNWIAWLCALFSVSVAAPVLLLFVAPPGRALISEGETLVVVLFPMLLFTAGGTALALLFRRYAAAGGTLYFYDLAAAALAAPASVLLLDLLGGINTPLLLALPPALAGLVMARRVRSPGAAVVSALALLGAGGLLGSNLAASWISLPVLSPPSSAISNPADGWWLRTKPLFAELADPFNAGRIVRTDWTAVSRTDVVHDPSSDVFYIYTDGDVPTQMEKTPDPPERAIGRFSSFIGILPFGLQSLARQEGGRGPEHVMAIGSGGGLDVMLALGAGASRVDAVEINPSIPRIVRDPAFAGTYARFYADPRVRLVVDEGRSFLQRGGSYDVIYFACAKTATTQTSGMALLDNHLYTEEAFSDYFRRLRPGGLAALVTQEAHLIDRLYLTALSALHRMGIPPAEAPGYLMTARAGDEQMSMGPYRYILMLRKGAWNAAQAAAAEGAMRRAKIVPLFVPHRQSLSAAGEKFDAQAPLPAVRRELEAFHRPYVPGGAITLSAVTDDSPFYVDIAARLHPFVGRLFTGAAVATAAVMLAALLFGLRSLRRAPLHERAALPLLIAGFFFLGAGFMLVELALMQKFLLLLGFPTRTLTVSLFALLLAGAAGSRLTQGWPVETARRRLVLFLPLLALLLFFYAAALPPLLQSFLSQPLPVRAALAALLLAAPGLAMGMPFPTLLRLLPPGLQALTPAFWSVNGVASIFGSVATMAIAKFWGYSGAMMAGAGCYLAMALIAALLNAAGSEEMAGSGGG